MRILIVLGSGLTLGLVASQGCAYRELDLTHCANNDGDVYCAERFPDGSRPYCQRGTDECYTANTELGCVAAEDRPADGCYSPCGGRSTIDENGECVMMEDSSSGSSSGTVTGESSSGSESSSSTTGPMPCVTDEECTEADAPFCGVSGECGTCDGTADPGGACAGVDAGLPLCVEGACVACTPENPVVCDQQLLLCDGGTNACVPCTEHGQCGSGACELAVGTCFPEGFVAHVDGDEVEMPPMMYASLEAAVADVDMGMHGVIVMHERNGDTPYTTPGGLVVDGDKRIALLAAPGEAPIVQGTGGNPGLAVEGAGTILYMDGLTVSLSPSVGLQVNDAFVWVDRSHIVQNSGGGVLAENSAELTLRNCFVVLNGGQFVDTRGITATGSLLDVVYTTVVANDGTGASGPISMSCDPASTGELRNSIVAATDDTIACENVFSTSSSLAVRSASATRSPQWMNSKCCV
jgi:hypothetical protein